MSLIISNRQIGTNPPVSFPPNNSLFISSAGITSSDNSGIILNTRSSLLINANGIVNSSGLSLAPISTAPSSSPDGFSVIGSVSGVKPAAPTIYGVALGASAGQVDISFTPSNISSGEPVIALTFIAYIAGVQEGMITTSTLTSPYTYSGLTTGQTYTFEMYASTASYAQGDLSNESASITIASPGPPLPTGINLGRVGGQGAGNWNLYIYYNTPIDPATLTNIIVNFQSQGDPPEYDYVFQGTAAVRDGSNAFTIGTQNYNGAPLSGWEVITPPGLYRARIKLQNANGISDWSGWSIDEITQNVGYSQLG